LHANQRKMPYFDGDYWPSELEDLAADMARTALRAKEGAALAGSKKRAADMGGGDETDQEVLKRGGDKDVDVTGMVAKVRAGWGCMADPRGAAGGDARDDAGRLHRGQAGA
jgi:hypothetical protein